MHCFKNLVLSTIALHVTGLVGCAADPADSADPESQAVVERGRGDGKSVVPGFICSPTNLVPAMTSATSPSGVVSRSGVYDSTYEAWQAFDATNNTMWISGVFQTPAWIAYQWTDGPRLVTNYAIDFVNGSLTSRAPRNWTFEGWNGAWNVIDTRLNEGDWLGVERRAYSVTFPGSYTAYRLNVSDDNDDRTGVVVVSMGRLELIGCPPSPPPPPPCGDGVCSPGESPSSCPDDCGPVQCFIQPCEV